jgi:hypothetical protein
MPEPTQADKDVAGGAMLLYELLRSDQWQIDPSCEALIECLPMVTRDEDEWEKPIKFDGDDAFEAARYSLKMRLGAAAKPTQVNIEDTIQEWKNDGRLSDPTSEMMWRETLKLRAKQKQQGTRFAYRGARRFRPQ